MIFNHNDYEQHVYFVLHIPGKYFLICTRFRKDVVETIVAVICEIKMILKRRI